MDNRFIFFSCHFGLAYRMCNLFLKHTGLPQVMSLLSIVRSLGMLMRLHRPSDFLRINLERALLEPNSPLLPIFACEFDISLHVNAIHENLVEIIQLIHPPSHTHLIHIRRMVVIVS